MFKIDLHTHSTASEDGGLSPDNYRRALKMLDFIAITDHNSVAQAKTIKRRLGKGIIVGSEISTAQGELIGLFLDEDVPPGLSLKQTIGRIHAQGGLAMAPHPFERWQRASLDLNEHISLIEDLDIVETYNGRSLSLAGPFKARRFAKKHGLAGAYNSDAHGPAGLGRTYTLIASAPTAKNLLLQLKSARFVGSRSTLKGYLEPSLNRRRAKIKPSKED